MDCACSMECEYESGEPCQHWSHRKVTARRDRQCSECRNPIPRGSEYTRHTFLEPASEGGKWHFVLVCPLCEEIGDCLFCTTPPVGWLWDEIGVNASEIGPDDLAKSLHKLSPAAGKLLCEKVLDDLIAEADHEEWADDEEGNDPSAPARPAQVRGRSKPARARRRRNRLARASRRRNRRTA